jgi:hypothetical protein
MKIKDTSEDNFGGQAIFRLLASGQNQKKGLLFLNKLLTSICIDVNIR